MERYFTALSLLAACILSSCSGNNMVVRIINPEGFDRITEMVEIPMEDIAEKIKQDAGESYIVRNDAGDIVPSQVTWDGKLIFQSRLGANEASDFTITTGAPQQYEPQTYGRYIKERKDDFAWENDCVAFRVYGPALKEIDGPSNGIDAWYKKTPELIIDKWYADDLAGKASYHDDHGQGMDDYKVGRTLGAGAMAPYAGGRLWLNENYVSQEVLENGPLRTTFRLTYKDIAVGDETFPESRLISIDAGSPFTRVIQSYGFNEPAEVAAGFPMRSPGDTYESSANWLIFKEPATAKSDGVFLAVVFPDGIERVVTDSYEIPQGEKGAGSYMHVLAVAAYQPQSPVTYYTGYGWTQYKFSDMNAFRTYTELFSKALTSPLVIEY